MVDNEAWETDPFDVELRGNAEEDSESTSTISALSDEGDMCDLTGFEMEWISPLFPMRDCSANLSQPSALTNSATASTCLDTDARREVGTIPVNTPDFTSFDDAQRQTLSYLHLNDLPDELLCQVGSFLNVPALKTARSLNARFRALLSLDEAGWTHHCKTLWQSKVHVTTQVQHLLSRRPLSRSTCALQAYHLSCVDAQLRREIAPVELCYDPVLQTGTVFSFRFKESAGPEWTSFDPWHEGKDARSMVFLPDGRVRQLVVVASKSNESTCSLRLPFYDATHSLGLEIRWKFVRKPIDLPARPDGAYIRLNVGGRDVPTYVVHRSPNGNWGFLLENCWGLFASFNLPRKRMEPSCRIGAATTTPPPQPPILRRRNRQDEHEEEDPPRKRRMMESEADVLADSSLTVTNNWQWREALLYNLGASTLPDDETRVNLEPM
jgi:hypothetical protein